MHVEDIKTRGLNVTAEVPEVEANNFIEMCKMFASTTSHERTVDQYLLKVSQLRSAILSNSSSLNILIDMRT